MEKATGESETYGAFQALKRRVVKVRNSERNCFPRQHASTGSVVSPTYSSSPQEASATLSCPAAMEKTSS